MINVGIMGATGYTGAELVRILRGHKHARIEMMTSTSQAGAAYGDVFPEFRHTPYALEAEDWAQMARRCDVMFLATPHGVAAARVTDALLADCAVIDLGADFRLRDADVYEEWYGLPHTARGLLPQAVYGLCEVYRERVRDSRLVANPGCYTTASILPLYPLLEAGLIEPDGIIVDAKSGVSGAGRGLVLGSLFCEANESVKAYKVAAHRHTPEIEQELSVAAGAGLRVTFTPHLIPMERGILAVSYAVPKGGVPEGVIRACYEARFGHEPFVRLCADGQFPETRRVCRTNFIDIGFAMDERTNRLIVISALDNLVKGAAGQAVQNMNILFGLPETEGLEA